MDVMSMKSSRRKQSKPIRVSHIDDSDMPLHPPPADDGYMNGGGMDMSDQEQEKENEMQASNASTCGKCSETFPSIEHLNEHVKMIHRDSMDFIRDSSFPTAYHRLGSELLLKNSFSPNRRDNSPIDGENHIDKNGNDVVDGEFGEKTDGEKVRDRSGIFHQDAYCELCDKEFCNKYFLKTHKANKHGIYDNSTSPFAPSVNPLPPSLVLPQDYSNLPFKINMDFPLPPLKMNMNGGPNKPPTPQLTPSYLPATSPQRQSPPSIPQPRAPTPTKPPQSPLPPLKTKSVYDLPPVSSASLDTPEKKTSPGSSINQDMEDFCEICQKHFCNKYYLKKHKNDVHGIAPPDTPNSNGKRGGRPPNSEHKLPPSTPVTSEPPLIPHSLANLTGMPNMPGVMVLNPFLPPMLIPTGPMMNQHGPLPPRPPHLPMSSPLPFPNTSVLSMSTSSESKYSLSPGSSNTSATSPSPSGSLSSETLRNMGIPVPDGASPSEALRRMGLMSADGQISSEALRGMGILNAEAFCDICRKEFCNKYFLKIHKANKHGVYMDEPLLPPSMSMSLPTKPSDLTTTSLPSNFPNEKEHSKEHYDNIKPDACPKPPITPVSQPIDYMTHCNLCNQEFASKYAYRIHRIQAHGMINEVFNEAELAEEAFRLHNGDLPKHISSKIAEEISAMDRNSEAAGFSSMFGSIVAAKLADRVNCDICNKELCNKYFLKAHKLKVHGIDINIPEKPPRPMLGMMPMERSLQKHDYSPMHDRRMELNNIARNFNLKPDKERSEMPSHSRPNSSVSMDNFNNLPVEKPSNEELVKLGMDPEAYCEICKKEFCSKYFLRTHKQNIHGIPPKTESQESTNLSKSLSMAPHLALSTPLLPSSFMGSMGSMGSSMMSMSMASSQMKPMNLSASSHSGHSVDGRSRSNGNNSSNKLKNGPSQNPNWKWKEPINSSRVTCELCNKELCNKYFLRTHKINKHGILPEDLSPCTSQNMSPNTSDMETSSNSSIPTDLSFDKSIQSPKLNLENSKLFTNKIDDMPMHVPEALNLKIKNESERYFNSFSMPETCHLCDKKFKSSKWLKQHIIKDHAGLTALSPTMEKAFNMGARMAPLELRTCSVCSIVFPSEMSMQLHMIQEHNAQVTIKDEPQSPILRNNGDSYGSVSGTVKIYGPKPRFSFSVKQKVYSCSVCSHKSKWLSKILAHERHVHRISHTMKKFCCKTCHKVFRFEKAYQSHMMKLHGDYSMSDLKISKRYRCNTCDRTFPTAIQCHLHIRKDHIRGQSFRVNTRTSDQRYTCNQCSFSTRYRKQLQRHSLRCHCVPQQKFNQSGLSDIEEANSGKNNIKSLNLHAKAVNGCENGEYVMQTFQIKQCNEEGVFVSSVVEMPVLKRLKNSASVSFMVTPLDEH